MPLEGREGLAFTDSRAGLCKEPHSLMSSLPARFVAFICKSVKNVSRVD